MLEAGADKNKKNKQDESPMDLAIAKKNQEVIDVVSAEYAPKAEGNQPNKQTARGMQ